MIEHAQNHLAPDQYKKLRFAHHLMTNIDESLLSGNFSKADQQELYSALEHLSEIDWKDIPLLQREDPVLRRDPSAIFRFIEDEMNGDKCFFTDYIILVRPMTSPNEYLVIPKADYGKSLQFLQMSKGDAYFKYVATTA